MLIECILLGSSLCRSMKPANAKSHDLPKQNAMVAVLKDRPVLALMSVDLSAKIIDYRQTERDFLSSGFRERNPVLRPMLGHPVAMYAYGAAYVMGAAWLGHKMRTSHNSVLRKLWWLPQTYSIEQNIYGFAYTRAHYTR